MRNASIYLGLCSLFFSAPINSYSVDALSEADLDRMSGSEIMDTYRAVREMSLDSSGAIAVDSCVLVKDVADLVFESGELCFFEPISGRVVAALFRGEGLFRISTDDEIEVRQLKRFTGADSVELEFTEALMIFVDGTYEELLAHSKTPTQQLTDQRLVSRARDWRRASRKRFASNADARILSDLVSREESHFFRVYLESRQGGSLVFTIDPLYEEQVSLTRYEHPRFSKRAHVETWYSSKTIGRPTHPGRRWDITHVDMDITIDSRELLTATSTLHLHSLVDQRRLVPMMLSPKLRVESVVLNDDTCVFIQEDKDLDGSLWIVFPEAVVEDSTYQLEIEYSGREVVKDVGGGNFVVGYRTSWYPTFAGELLDLARYQMKFSIPEGMTLLATGSRTRAWDERGASCSEWRSEREYAVAGFNYGKFHRVEERSPCCHVECYTNMNLSNDLLQLRRALELSKDLQMELMMLPHEVTTEKIGKNAAIESRNAYEVFVHFFGEIPFTEIAVSQQPQTAFGQSWPSLVYLPFQAFFSESMRDRLGLVTSEGDALYYETLASHEIAHQWWGHTVMADSYHDQWLDEGFATYSEGLYLQTTEGVDRFEDYMETLRRTILGKTEERVRATELGPIWLGRRLSSLKTPQGHTLIYAKGAYVLHMIRMMLFDYDKKSDSRFIAMMKDYVDTYAGTKVTTDEFRRFVEKHVGEDMDWFFDQWVYGCEIPVYHFTHRVEPAADGQWILTVSVRQEGVSQDFRMPLRFVINFEGGHAVGGVLVTGTEPVVKQLRLPVRPKSVDANPWGGVLCEIRR
jgi:hypothetical protein